MNIIVLLPKVVSRYIANFPEVRNNAYKYFNYDHRVVEERMERGDEKMAYKGPNDFDDNDYANLVDFAKVAIDKTLARYSMNVACEDALHKAIKSYGNGMFDGKVNSSRYHVLLTELKKNLGIMPKVRPFGIPDGTGPHGFGLGPGHGRGDGTGLRNGPIDFEKRKVKPFGIPDGTGPHGLGLGPGRGRGDGTGLRNAVETIESKKKREREETKILHPRVLRQLGLKRKDVPVQHRVRKQKGVPQIIRTPKGIEMRKSANNKS
jgi:hypothetical protein